LILFSQSERSVKLKDQHWWIVFPCFQISYYIREAL